MPQKILCPVTYWGPASYYRAWALADEGVMEGCENYTRQTYRNRCLIYGANGVIPLSVPVKRAAEPKVNIRDVEIDYSTPWQRLHLKTLVSAYRRSPYFEYYIDDLEDFFRTPHKLLFDYDMAAFSCMCGLLGMKPNVSCSDTYVKIPEEGVLDLREAFDPHLRADLPAYEQVFSPRHGFESDLSILDVLFNLGPDSVEYLMQKR